MIEATATLTTKPCRACGERPAIRGTIARRGSHPAHLPGRLCVLCLARLIDAAYGWRTQANIAQGLTAHDLGKEIRARKRAKAIA